MDKARKQENGAEMYTDEDGVLVGIGHFVFPTAVTKSKKVKKSGKTKK